MAATKEEVQNLAQFKAVYASVTSGIEGVKHDGDLFKEAKWANKNSATLLNDFTPGKAGVRHEGHLYGILRRTEHNSAQAMANTAATNATIQALVGAIKALSGGQTFDEAKLLKSIEETTKASFAEALKAAAPAEVTLKVEGGQE